LIFEISVNYFDQDLRTDRFMNCSNSRHVQKEMKFSLMFVMVTPTQGTMAMQGMQSSKMKNANIKMIAPFVEEMLSFALSRSFPIFTVSRVASSSPQP